MIEGDSVGRGFAGIEVGCGELGFCVDSNKASVVGFFGGVVAFAGSSHSPRSDGDRSPILLEMSKSTCLTHESMADFQLLTSFWSVDLLKNFDKRPWVLINETTVESSVGFSNGCLSPGTCSLMSV